MKISLFTYSKTGIETARRIAAALGGGLCAYTVPRLAAKGFAPIPTPSAQLYSKAFSESEALIFVGSCGIAVRCIAPYVKSKTTDPAVVVTDERGRFVVPILSGHLGGANALAERVAAILGATPVITTATDINGRFSVDAWAKANSFAIADMGLAKAVSAAVLEGDVPIKSDFPIKGALPAGLSLYESGALGCYFTYTRNEPFGRTLRLIPKCLHLGIGCRRGVSKQAVAEAVRLALEGSNLDPRAIKCAASIALKKDEAGLLEYCREVGLPISFYSARELNAVEGEFTGSDFVKQTTGVDCVCERAALIQAERLIIKKLAADGVTVAVALDNTEVHFG